ncbi:hypothetical protein [Micromonospora sp. NBC_01796]|uniref:hypothetical protein n=1 Tax=Micromonospora sp. NBC_01796 TaxID=2975987 RepID=UPI002DD79ED2|nr:hypothetical protein [Micromonospora sp. NBC_01796]WSA86326.1 hypothetical protein OIE47_01525 [Micromonospora sp. NBC_01796]
MTIDAALPRHRQQLTWIPLPIAVLTAGLLLNAGVTVWDLLHFKALFNYGSSQNGAIAYLLEGAFAYLRLSVTTLLVPILWIAARRARVAGSRSPGVIGPICGVLAVCGGGWVVAAPNDGSDPKRLGIVHDAGVPNWISVADVVAPYAVLIGAVGAVLLTLSAFMTWARRLPLSNTNGGQDNNAARITGGPSPRRPQDRSGH